MQGYHFTDRVRRALAHAREESGRLGHEYVGTEHLLLGVLRVEDSVAAQILADAGVKPAALRDKIEETVKRGNHVAAGPDLPYTSRAKRVLELAMSEAREGGYNYVGTGHLLLGIAAEEKGIGAQVLHYSGFRLDAGREALRRIAPSAETSEGMPPGQVHVEVHAISETKSPAKLLLSISAILAGLIGLQLILSPQAFEGPMEITLDDKTTTIAQAQGALLIGLGFINWMMRGVSDRGALNAVLYGNFVVQMVSLAVVLRALVRGIIPFVGAGGAVMHVVLGAAFAWQVWRVRRSG